MTSVSFSSAFWLPLNELNEIKVTGKLVDWLITIGVGNETSSSNNQFLRNSGFTLQIPFLNKYGCWCYRGNDYPAGKGSPRDQFDEVCKRHHMGMDCIVHDTEDGLDPNCQQDGTESMKINDPNKS